MSILPSLRSKMKKLFVFCTIISEILQRGTGLPVFEWSAFPDLPHQGLPPKYDFDPVHMKPKLVDPLVFGADYFKRKEEKDTAEIAFDATLKELNREQEEVILAGRTAIPEPEAEAEPVVIA